MQILRCFIWAILACETFKMTRTLFSSLGVRYRRRVDLHHFNKRNYYDYFVILTLTISIAIILLACMYVRTWFFIVLFVMYFIVAFWILKKILNLSLWVYKYILLKMYPNMKKKWLCLELLHFSCKVSPIFLLIWL